jgi:hypothetical protein
MKRLAYISLAFFATAALFSCTEKSTYEPGPQASGAQYYFSSDQATSVNISHTTQSVSIDVFRLETGSASTATVSVVDESGLISSASSVTANFAAGSNKATLTFPITPSDWEFAKNYPVNFTIFDESTPYGKSELTVTYKYPTPLKSLGKAQLTENYFTGQTFTPQVYQSEIDPNEYHIQKFMGAKSEDLIIHVTKAGDKFGNVSFTQAGLVYFDDAWSGITYADVNSNGKPDQHIDVCHPAGFKSYSTDESKWAGSKVVLFQDNGIPAVVEIAPFYYISGLGGWDQTQTPANITIIFPGYEPKDYAVEANYAGLFTESDGTVYGEASVTLGADLEGGVAVIVPGADEDAIAAGIEKLVSDEAVAFDGSTVRVPLPKDVQTGFYTIVVGGVADGVVQEVDAVPFYYQGGPLDWDWLLSEWKAYDYNLTERVVEGDPYEMTITKVDDTHIKIGNLWGTEAEFDAVVDFDAMTITIPGYQFAFTASNVKGDLYFVAVDPENEYDVFEDLTTPVVVKMTPGGLVVDNYDFYIGSGNYKGYTYDGGIRTTMFKPLP